MVERAVNEFGKLDILVNNAAYQMTHKSIAEISDEEWDHTFRTNIYSMFYLSKAAVARCTSTPPVRRTSSSRARAKGSWPSPGSTKA